MLHENNPADDSERTARFAIERFSAARREIDLRIAIQNLILLTAVISAQVFCVLALMHRTDGVALSLIFSGAVQASALIWGHNGIRHAQIRCYVVEVIEPRMASAGEGWEAFVEAVRPSDALGTRWRLSTYGVFCGAQALVGAACWYASGAWSCLVVAFIGSVLTVLLLSHPPLKRRES